MIAGSIFRIFILLSIQNFKAPEVRGQLNPQEPGTLNHIQKIGWAWQFQLRWKIKASLCIKNHNICFWNINLHQIIVCEFL